MRGALRGDHDRLRRECSPDDRGRSGRANAVYGDRRAGGARSPPRTSEAHLEMIAFPSGARVWLATGRTDMRKGFGSLALLVQEALKRDPSIAPSTVRKSGPLK